MFVNTSPISVPPVKGRKVWARVVLFVLRVLFCKLRVEPIDISVICVLLEEPSNKRGDERNLRFESATEALAS